MLKREITYENFDGQTVTDTYYFNLTKTELITLELSYDEGLEASFRKIVEADNKQALIEEFKKIVLLAYGVRSEDGKRFIKNDQVREEFSQTAAYDSLFMELATNEDASAMFIKGIVPLDMQTDINVAVVSVNTPPLPPTEG